MKILLVNWQDRENPQGGGAEIHLHEIFGRLASAGHDVRLLCGGWPDCPPRAVLDGIDVHRAGTRYTFPFVARAYYDRHLSGWADVLVEDINKVPLYTTRW
ncbi:MAG: glycosyltransferase, partial [Gemmatimonadaceae bacterium]